jgi:hypothetical protein
MVKVWSPLNSIAIIRGHYFIRQIAITIQSENIFHYGWQGSARRQSHFLPVDLLAFQFNVLQSISCFCSPYLKKMLENNSFVSQKRVTHNKHAVNCTSKYYNLSESTGSDWQKFWHKMSSLNKSNVRNNSDKRWKYDVRNLLLNFFTYQLMHRWNVLKILLQLTFKLTLKQLRHVGVVLVLILTLSDPTSTLARQYDFPVLLRSRKTSDAVFVAFVRPLSEPVRRFSSCSTDFSQQIAQVVLFLIFHVFLF